jgi:hypothetical protein
MNSIMAVAMTANQVALHKKRPLFSRPQSSPQSPIGGRLLG